MSRLVLIVVLSLLAVSAIDGAHILNKRSFMKKASHFVHNVEHAVAHATSDAAHGVGHVATKAAHNVADFTKDAAQDIGHFATDAAHDIADFSKDAAQDIGHFATDAAHDIADFSKDTAHKLGRIATDAAQDIADFTEDAAQKVGHVAADAADDIAEFTKDTAHDAADVVSDAADDVSDFVMDSIDDIKDFSHASRQQIKEARKFLVKEYYQAKKLFEQVIHSQEFKDAVNKLIPYIDGKTAVNTCTNVCHGAADDVLGLINFTPNTELTDLIDRSCPSVCKGALSKLKNLALKALENLTGTDAA